MAVASLKGPLISSKMERNNSGKRRVFVQTETGCVLGMELDGSDIAQTVKKRLQLALNVPTEETSLICGDMVIKNDLSTVRNHSPLLLTRNCLHRSSSSPSLSPCAKDAEEKDQSFPIELIGCSSHFPGTKLLVNAIVRALKNGVDPLPIRGGLGGAYFFKDCEGENVAIVKPTDEEPFAPNNPKGFVGKALGQPGLKRSVRVGETGFREVAAYLLDHVGFANVPLTALVKVTHSIFNLNGSNHTQKDQISKIASFQQFIPHDCDASDHGTSSFPVVAVHRIGILDIRIMNTDRHAGNLLVRKLDKFGTFNQVELVPIDHGLCLPESLEDPYFEWIHWPQASIPFSEEELEYIANLDPFHDSEMLRMELPMIREACLRVLIFCTVFLKAAVRFGLCLAEIGEMMSREFRGHGEEPSELERICIDARSLQQARRMNRGDIEGDEDGFFQFDLEYENSECDLSRHLRYKLGIQDKGRSKILFRLDESAEEGQEAYSIELKGKGAVIRESGLSVSKAPMTLKAKAGVSASSRSSRSVNYQHPASPSFVTVADMAEEEWQSFLGNFEKLLGPTFLNHKAGRAGQRVRQRLGTSCKF